MTQSTERAYTLIDNLAGLVDTIPPQSILSRTIYRDEQLKAVLFAFDAGQELSEHTSSQAAILQIVEGRATLTLGSDRHELEPGSWLHMPPRLKHSIYAQTPLIMMLVLLDPAPERPAP